jgi:hypothetical protein
MLGLALWLVFLGWSFTIYPAFDNLVVGWVVFVLQGVDALGSLSSQPVKFFALLLTETVAVAIVSAGIGYLIEAYVTSRRI